MAITRMQTIRSHLTSERFHDWYREREYRQNIQEGKPYFNGPSSPPQIPFGTVLVNSSSAIERYSIGSTTRRRRHGIRREYFGLGIRPNRR